VAAVEALGESMALVEKAGVSKSLFLSIVAEGFLKSPVYANYGRMILEERFEPPAFKLKLGLKDMRLASQAADSNDVPMPLLSLVRDRLLAGVGRGDGEKDLAALGGLAAKDAGL
jgi:3-hydroxyisobutyrate dehydrogenase-like beta-hydroxyacid dehydrogenase